MNSDTSPAWQRHASAILSGFLGDWLEARNNPLALPMTVFHGSGAVDPCEPDIEAPGSTLCLSIHGLMELETVWGLPGQPSAHYGSLLADVEQGITPSCCATIPAGQSIAMGKI